MLLLVLLKKIITRMSHNCYKKQVNHTPTLKNKYNLLQSSLITFLNIIKFV
jgi:hypothetical protein